MPRIHVCSLARVPETVLATSASHVLTLIKNPDIAPTPAGIAAHRHLKLNFADITEPREGEIAPAEELVEDILRFVAAWDRALPMVVHCYAGISRSTAGAFIAACQLMPDRSEHELATLIRKASPTATPNARLVTFADKLLSRNRRMTEAIGAIGRGADCFEGVPFHIDIR